MNPSPCLKSALSGCRLLPTGICSHELPVTPGQEPFQRLWFSRSTLHEWDHSWDLTLQLSVCLEDAVWFMCLSRVVCLQSHLLYPASTSLGILVSTLQGVHAARHHTRKYTQPCHILLKYPGAGKLQLPRPSHLDPARLRHPPPMGRAHYRPDGARRRTRGELEARAKKKARREQEAAAAAAAPSRRPNLVLSGRTGGMMLRRRRLR